MSLPKDPPSPGAPGHQPGPQSQAVDVLVEVEEPQFADLDRFNKCHSCRDGRLKLSKRSPELTGRRMIGLVLLSLSLMAFAAITLQYFTIEPNGYDPRRIQERFYAYSFLVLAPIALIGYHLSKRLPRYRCNACDESISKEEYLARSRA